VQVVPQQLHAAGLEDLVRAVPPLPPWPKPDVEADADHVQQHLELVPDRFARLVGRGRTKVAKREGKQIRTLSDVWVYVFLPRLQNDDDSIDISTLLSTTTPRRARPGLVGKDLRSRSWCISSAVTIINNVVPRRQARARSIGIRGGPWRNSQDSVTHTS